MQLPPWGASALLLPEYFAALPKEKEARIGMWTRTHSGQGDVAHGVTHSQRSPCRSQEGLWKATEQETGLRPRSETDAHSVPSFAPH